MAQSNDIFGMLDLMVLPGFCVENGKIIKINRCAEGCMVNVGDAIGPLLRTGQAEYAGFEDGCLYLTLEIAGQPWGATVTRIGNYHIFLLEQEAEQPELRAMALAATELRTPLANVMAISDALFQPDPDGTNPIQQEKIAQLNRGLFQMLRLILNMSDANRYSTNAPAIETVNICGIMESLFHSAGEKLAQAGKNLTFQNLSQPVYCLANPELLERAVLNLLSNAAKFTPAGGSIVAKLTRKDQLLCLTIQDNGEGIPEDIQGSLFHRYRRIPAIEDGRFGIGLGMSMVRSAAAHHGGTVLLDRPGETGTRVTMTIAIRESRQTTLRSPIFSVDYAGGRDRTLIELSESLPYDAYESKKIN